MGASTDGREVHLVGEAREGGGGGGGASGGDIGTAPDEESPPEARQDPLRWDWTVEDMPEVTIEDLASFAPSAGTVIGEPAGWGIVGLHTNFYSSSQAQVLEGELLGQPASVRFTPIGWHWSYGDGATRSVDSPGEAWVGREAEFEPTATSHRYGSAGTYQVRLAVELGADYRFADGDWVPVAGTVFAEAEPLDVRIGTADTVLVQRGCDARPALGC